MSESLDDILARIPLRDNRDWMFQMLKEDLSDFLHELARVPSEEGWKWKKFRLQQAWWCLTCIFYHHGVKNE